MTRDRDFKREVRARMRATGERYTQARSALHESTVATPPIRSRPDPERGNPNVRRTIFEHLNRDGYAVVRNVVSDEVVGELRQLIDRLVDDDLAWRMEESATLNRSTERRRDLWMSFSRDDSVGQAVKDYWAR